jgi:hypothetical protein
MSAFKGAHEHNVVDFMCFVDLLDVLLACEESQCEICAFRGFLEMTAY